MSDLDELIAEARNSFKATNASANLIHRLADALEAANAESDAALAVIERVREIHAPLSSLTWGAPDEFQVCEECNDPDARGFIYWPCPTVAALDGAPEPEEKP